MIKYVYIASPYTLGDKKRNTIRSLIVAEILIERGYVPFAPLLSHYWHKISPHDYDYWMQLDLDWMVKCDIVLRLPGRSKGADLEVRIAKSLDIPVVYSLEELELVRELERCG